MNLHVIITILIILIAVTRGFRLYVTQDLCGQTINISKWKMVNLDFVETNVFSKPGTCVIYITTSNDTDICIRQDRRTSVDKICSWTLSYYIGGYHNKPTKKYTCKDFNYFQKPICGRERLASIVYVGDYMFRNASENVVLFANLHHQELNNTPTSRLSRLPRSVESEYSKRLKKKQSVGIIVGLLILGLFGILACIYCCYIKGGSDDDNADTQANTPLQTHPQPESEQRNDHVNQADNYASTSTSNPPASNQLRYSEGPPTYDQYILHKQDYYQVPNQETDEHTVELPPPEYKTKPSAPPPPYPGF